MDSSPKPTDPINRLTRQQITKRFTHTVRGCGLAGIDLARIRQAEENGKPIYYESYPISLQDFAAILSGLDQVWRCDWLPARELPEYVRRDKRALLDMGIYPMPRLLGPYRREQDQSISWNVAAQDTDDPDLMGHIAARQLSSGETFVEFWLEGFPDFHVFADMRCDIEEEMARILLARLDAPPSPQSDEKVAATQEVIHQPPDDKALPPMYLVTPPELVIEQTQRAVSHRDPMLEPPDDEAPPATHQEPLQDVTVEQAKQLVSDRNTMLQYMPKRRGYDPDTAIAIVSAIPTAWTNLFAGQWGPGCIAKACRRRVTAGTVGRYLKAFVARGITRIEGIEIPHRFRGESRR